MSGSGLFSKQQAAIPHSMPREVEDLRNDVKKEFAPLAAITVEEFTNPPASGAAVLLAATATVAAPVTVLAAALTDVGGKAVLLAQARNITFTTAGSTASDAPATALITGTDRDGHAQTETVTLAQTATIAKGVKLFKTITKIEYPAADGTGATVAIGIGDAMPLSKTPKTRAGLAAIIREVAVGALVTTGAIDATNKSYTPATATNGTNDYCVFYEFDPTV